MEESRDHGSRMAKNCPSGKSSSVVLNALERADVQKCVKVLLKFYTTTALYLC